MRKANRRAKYSATLVYYDEPHLILLSWRKSKVIAVAIPEASNKSMFLASVISEREWDRYLEGIVDLRYLFSYSSKDSLFKFDLNKMNKNYEVTMSPCDMEDVLEEHLPQRQFFSRDHTEPGTQAQQAKGRQRFGIDGQWDLPDFAQFYNKYSDVYAFELALGKWRDPSAGLQTKRKIADAFQAHPFRGGSSYGNFYDDLVGILPFDERPRVEGVEYHSPGWVSIKGRQDVFNYMYAAFRNFDENREKIKASYRYLHTHLSKLGFLKISPKQFDNKTPTADAIMQEADNLSRLLKISGFKDLVKLCDNNSLVVAKVVLSYCRRIDRAFDFFAEGRVQFL